MPSQAIRVAGSVIMLQNMSLIHRQEPEEEPAGFIPQWTSLWWAVCSYLLSVFSFSTFLLGKASALSRTRGLCLGFLKSGQSSKIMSSTQLLLHRVGQLHPSCLPKNPPHLHSCEFLFCFYFAAEKNPKTKPKPTNNRTMKNYENPAAFPQVPQGYFELGHFHYECNSQGCVCTICRLQPPTAQGQSQKKAQEQSQILRLHILQWREKCCKKLHHHREVALIGLICEGTEVEDSIGRSLVSNSFSVFSVPALSIGI